MPVVTAGMHHARTARSVRKVSHLRDRQGIHVSPQTDTALRVSPRQGRDKTVAADPSREGNAEVGKSRLDEGGGRLFVKGKLGICVQVPTPIDQLLMEFWSHYCLIIALREIRPSGLRFSEWLPSGWFVYTRAIITA
jgi:hypothetical protein